MRKGDLNYEQIGNHFSESSADCHGRALQRSGAEDRIKPARTLSRGHGPRFFGALPRPDLREMRALPDRPWAAKPADPRRFGRESHNGNPGSDGKNCPFHHGVRRLCHWL